MNLTDTSLSDEVIIRLARDFMLGEEFLTHPMPRYCFISYLRNLTRMGTRDALAFIDLYLPDVPKS